MSLGSEIRSAKAKAVGGKKDRCRKGKSCSATCISGWKACLVEMPDMVSASVKKFANAVQSKVAQIKKNPERVIPGKKQDAFKDKKTQQFFLVQAKLRSQLFTLAAKGDKKRYDQVEKKLLALQESANRNLGKQIKKNPYYESVNKKEIWGSEKGSREGVRRTKYQELKDFYLRNMKIHAKDGNKKLYDNLEEKLLRIQEKAGAKLGDTNLVAKGSTWETIRKGVRSDKYKKVVSGLNRQLKRAALTGDRKAYGEIEKKLAKVASRTGSKLGFNDSVKEGEMWARYEGTLPNKLGQGLAKPGSKTTMEVQDLGGLTLNTMILGNKLSLGIKPYSLDFKVNDSYLDMGNLSMREKVAIIRELKKQFPEVISNMREGTVLEVSASRGDGKHDMREGAYIDFGFSTPNRWGAMFGRVENGKVVAIDHDEYKQKKRDTFQ
jgi:hypothetical protein